MQLLSNLAGTNHEPKNTSVDFPLTQKFPKEIACPWTNRCLGTKLVQVSCWTRGCLRCRRGFFDFWHYRQGCRWTSQIGRKVRGRSLLLLVRIILLLVVLEWLIWVHNLCYLLGHLFHQNRKNMKWRIVATNFPVVSWKQWQDWSKYRVQLLEILIAFPPPNHSWLANCRHLTQLCCRLLIHWPQNRHVFSLCVSVVHCFLECHCRNLSILGFYQIKMCRVFLEHILFLTFPLLSIFELHQSRRIYLPLNG